MKLNLKTAPLRGGKGSGFFLDQGAPLTQRDFTGGINRAVPPTAIDAAKELYIAENCMMTYDNVLRTRYGTSLVEVDAGADGNFIQGVGRYNGKLFYARAGKVFRRDSATVFVLVGTVATDVRVCFLNFGNYLVILDGGYIKLYWESSSNYYFKEYGMFNASEINRWRTISKARTYIAEDLGGDVFPKASFGVVVKNRLWLSGNQGNQSVVYVSGPNDPFDYGNNHDWKLSYVSGLVGGEYVTKTVTLSSIHTFSDVSASYIKVLDKNSNEVELPSLAVMRVYKSNIEYVRGFDYQVVYNFQAKSATIIWGVSKVPAGSYSVDYAAVYDADIVRTCTLTRSADLSYDVYQDLELSGYSVVEDSVKFYYNSVLGVQYVKCPITFVIGLETYILGQDFDFIYLPDSQSIRVQWKELGKRPAAGTSYVFSFTVTAWLDEAYVPTPNLGTELAMAPDYGGINDSVYVTGLTTFVDSVLVHTKGIRDCIYRVDGNEIANFTVSAFIDSVASCNPYTSISLFGGSIFLASNGIYFVGSNGQCSNESLKINSLFSLYGFDFSTASSAYSVKYGIYVICDKDVAFAVNVAGKGWSMWKFPYSISKVEVIDGVFYFCTYCGKIYMFDESSYMDGSDYITTVIGTAYYDFGSLSYSKYIKCGYVVLQALMNVDAGITRISFIPDYTPLLGTSVLRDMGAIANYYRSLLSIPSDVVYDSSLHGLAEFDVADVVATSVSQTYIISNTLSKKATAGYDDSSFGFDRADVFYGFDYSPDFADANVLLSPARNIRCPVSCRCTSISVVIESVGTPVALNSVELIWAPLRPAP